jgi:hypothetical protein
MIKTAAALAVLALALTGCGGTSTAVSPKPTVTVTVPATSAAPTEKAPDVTTAKGVGDALAEQIPQMKVTTVYTEVSDPNDLLGRPSGYGSKIAFSDTRVEADDANGTDKDDLERGGSIEVYADPEQAKTRASYIATIQKSSSLFGSEYHYLDQGVLVRVTGNLTPTVAKDYQAALENLS